MIFTFAVNGTTVTVKSHPMRRLLDVLREDLGLSGTKEGCGEGECGACAVRLDGALVNSCLGRCQKRCRMRMASRALGAHMRA